MNEVMHQKLVDWARTNQVSNDPYVSGLANALFSKTNLAMWAELSPIEHLPRPTHSVKGSKLLATLVLLRNTLIFVPVALTWTAVGHATDAFGQYVSQNLGTVVNFLEFWQNGYGVLAPQWRIAGVANADFLIILTVIGLIFATSYLGRKDKRLRLAMAHKLDAERMELAIELSEFLFEKRTITTVTFNQSIASTVKDLLAAGKALSEVTKAMAKSEKVAPTNKQVMAELKKLSGLNKFRD
jgi:hypothetical protein